MIPAHAESVAGQVWGFLERRQLVGIIGILVMLFFSALLLTGGFFTQVTAIRMGELSFVSPFAFSGIIVALILGILIWHDEPTPAMLSGIVLIVGSCIYIARSR